MLEAYGRTHSPGVYPRNEHPLRKVIDRFVIKGSEGKHVCIVHAPPSIDMDEMHSGDKLNLDAMRSTIRQLLIILNYLHTDCFLTARIFPIVIFKFPSDTNYEVGVDPIKYHEANPDVESEEVSEFPTTLLPGDGIPLLGDFRDDDDTAGLVTKHIRSPEEIFKSPWGYKVDIWAIAICVSRPESKQAGSANNV